MLTGENALKRENSKTHRVKRDKTRLTRHAGISEISKLSTRNPTQIKVIGIMRTNGQI